MLAPDPQKQLIRKEIAARKAVFSKETLTAHSQKICARLVQTETFQKANCIALYYATNDEVQTSGLIEYWRQKKKIVLPVVVDDTLHFYAYKGEERLKKGTMGVYEPDTTLPEAERIALERIDLFVVPGIAFDRDGNRMGRGKGYYDRSLSGIFQPVIGLCFDFQLLPRIPVEPHDRSVTCIITESSLLAPDTKSR
jgi:5-formyltetrahydrofolate cyclo-ligase